MVVAEDGYARLERSTVEWLSLGIEALRSQQHGEIVRRGGRRLVLVADAPLVRGERFLIELRRLIHVAELLMEESEVVRGARECRMRGAKLAARELIGLLARR